MVGDGLCELGAGLNNTKSSHTKSLQKKLIPARGMI